MARPVEGSPRRALVLLVASGVALAGIITLVVVWLGIGVTALDAGRVQTEPCLVAYQAGTHDAAVHYTAFPARSVCTWTVDGAPREVVVASAAPAVVAGGLTAAVLGGAAVVVVGVLGRRR
ncbi:hypothetical protein [Cellulomonas sp. WB94]|uniref:hypothetical protein n=1 Tax=Cellulomonas sp. WB94 TaxID=2173174 RepID=UPI0011B2333A|nr:hypothetical protein [Cellulomonas sp. WB94]